MHVSRSGLLDEVEVHCELEPQAGRVDEPGVRAIAEWVERRVKDLIGISARVLVKEPESIERTLTGKARRVIDKRPK